jgi:RHS repeat-associated protein
VQVYAEGYRYGFNGMEKDDEVKGGGNSYDFGARMYDARVGRFLSRDNFEKKYPFLSSYSFSNNSPIFYKDFDGNDWGQTTKINKDGSKTIILTLNAAVLNSSNTSVDMNAFKVAVETQVTNNYTVSWNEQIGTKMNYKKVNGITMIISEPVYRKVNVIVQTEIRVINKVSDLENNEHLLEIVDPIVLNGNYGETNFITGKKIMFNSDYVPNMINGNDNNTISHELGHTFGLRHINAIAETIKESLLPTVFNKGNPQYISPASQAKDPNNMMFSGGSDYMNDKNSTNLAPWQMRTGLKLLKEGKLNKEVEE